MLGCISLVQAQTVRITGTVKGAQDGLSIPGVSVVVKGTNVGANTDLDGKYTLNVPTDATTLLFSFVGMTTQEIPIDGKTVIDVALVSESVQVEELVVVAYGTTRKSSFTGSAQKVDAESIEKISATSIDKALQGTIAGLQINNTSGQPGSQANVVIRGVGSLNAASSPLYVVDGIPVTSGNYSQVASSDYSTSSTVLSTLNPNDIASITVLKDASAASLYGSRAANGVIIITTKQGKKGESKIDFTANYGISDLAVKRADVLSSSQYWKLYWDYYYNKGVAAGNLTPGTYANGQTTTRLAINPYNNANPYDETGNLKAGVKLLYNSDWNDAIYRIGKNEEYNLSASGGTEKMNYFLSGGYLNQTGIVIGSDFKRYSAKVNVNADINKHLTVGTNNSLSLTKQNTPPGGGGAANYVGFADKVANIYPIYKMDADGKPLVDIFGKKIYEYQNPIVLDFNPLGIQSMDKYYTESVRVLSSAFAEVSFLKDFKFKTVGSVDYIALNEGRYYNPLHGNGKAVSGRSSKINSRDIRTNFTNTLTWGKKFGDHNVDVLLGQEAFKSHYENIYAEGTGFPFAGNDNLIGASVPVTASSYWDEKTISSYFSRLNYNFMDKYYFSGSLRRDGSSVFGKDKRWGTFYSLGLTWRVSQEEFIKSITFINDLKLRASYGTSGNDNIARDASLGLFSLGYNYEGLPGLAYTQLANPTLRWEKNKNFDFGVEFRVFNRLSGEFDYYKRTSSDLLIDQQISYTTGFATVLTNFAEMENSGVELRLTSTNITSGEFKWDTDFNIAMNKNEIKKMPVEFMDQGSKRWRVGTDRYQFFLQKYAGVNSANGAAMWYKDVKDGAGVVIGRELTQTYSEATKYESGSALPKYIGGITNTFSYKGLEFSFFFYYSLGGNILDYTMQDMMHDGSVSGEQLSTDILNAWKKAGDVTSVPVFIPGNTSNSDQLSTRYLHDASYVRLRNIMLSYTLPQKLVNRVKVRSAKIFVKADNMWTWRAYDGAVDPEMSLAGTSNNDVPNVKTISFGINLGL